MKAVVRRSSLRAVACAVAALSLLALGSTTSARATDPPPALDFRPTPDVACVGAQDHPEAIQGRTPLADFASGRADLGYTCNATKVSQVGAPGRGSGSSGGYRVYRYTDRSGRVCAFYDTTLLFPANVYAAGTDLTGVWVLDMTHPEAPVHTATLSTPAMQSPHESFSLNVNRGLLGAVFANPAFHAGQFDVYSVADDCTHPVLQSTLPVGFLGHEGSFAPDGLTYYASSLYGHTLAAIDVSDPTAPKTVWVSADWTVHGMNVSDDGNTLYFADLGSNRISTGQGTSDKGLTVLDVSEIQARTPLPQVHKISHITWPVVSTPQTDIPVTVAGHPYLVEVDEFATGDNVGAARIVDIADPAHPAVVSNMRLAVNNADHRNDGSQQNDPNATSSLQGYAGHYCSVPKETDPTVVACSFILSGLRLFDIRDLTHPKEIAYFNYPSTAATPGLGPQGSYAMSQPAFDVANRQVWYSDGNSGFYVVQIDPNVWSF